MKTKRSILTALGLASAIAFCGQLLAQDDTAPDKAKAAQAKEFKANPTFDDAIRSAMRKTRTPFLTRVKVWLAMRNEEVRYEMELALTEKAMELGVVQPEGVDGAGVYGGPWTDLLDWVIANWDEILKIIMTIVDIFTDQQAAVDYYSFPADDVRFCSLDAPQCSSGTCAASPAAATCSGGTCAATGPPTRSVLVRRSTPSVDVMRSRTVTAWRRSYRPRRMLLWRRFH